MTQDVDVLIIGAGLSGVGAAHHLRQECPQLSYLVMEGRDDLGSTWDLFRYPGIRSDSDMYTMGYDFKAAKCSPMAVWSKNSSTYGAGGPGNLDC